MKCYTTDCTTLEGLKLEMRSNPKPSAGEVLVDVHSVSLNYRDLLVSNGKYGYATETPFIACSDMAGVVAAVGEGVEGFKPGQRVFNAPFKNWPAGELKAEWASTFVGGNGLDGVLAEQLVYPTESLIPLPDNLTMEEGSTLTVAGLTAWAAIMTHGKTHPGDWVLLHGTGGVSVFAAQLASALGANVIMSTSSEEKAMLVREKFGVEHTFDYREADWSREVKKWTGGGANVVVEVAGGSSLGQSLKACTFGARVAVIGVLDGLDSQINVFDLIRHQITVRGIYMESTEELRAFANAVKTMKLKPVVDRVFSFEQAKDAFAYLNSQQHMGKVVIKVR
jgi:NADPH:quinone reductase-like Zn-dependent oxidoreductase